MGREERRRRDERRYDLVGKCLKTQIPPDELSHTDSEKKIPSIIRSKVLNLSIIYLIRIRISVREN